MTVRTAQNQKHYNDTRADAVVVVVAAVVDDNMKNKNNSTNGSHLNNSTNPPVPPGLCHAQSLSSTAFGKSPLACKEGCGVRA